MRLLLLLAMVLSLSSCAKEDDGNMGKFSKPDTLPQKFSYVYGFLLAEAAADYRDMDYSQVIHGISDYSYSSPEFSAPEMNDILTRYQQLLLAEMSDYFPLQEVLLQPHLPHRPHRRSLPSQTKTDIKNSS